MKFYWIDALDEYENTITNGVLKAFDLIYKPHAKKNGFEFEYIDASKILLASSDKNRIIYNGKDILQNRASVYISYTNAHPQMEKILESVFRIANHNKKWTIVNLAKKGILIDKDKFAGFSLAGDLGMPVIPSVIIPSNKKSRTMINNIEEILGSYPYIVKPKEMLAGIGIVKIDSREAFKSTLDIIGQSPRDYIAQSFIEKAEDYRVYTKKGKVIACLKRQALKGAYIANISQAGKGKSLKAPQKIARLTELIANAIGSDYLCVDWLVAGKKIWFSEIETGGGFSALTEPEKSKVAKAFFQSNSK